MQRTEFYQNGRERPRRRRRGDACVALYRGPWAVGRGLRRMGIGGILSAKTPRLPRVRISKLKFPISAECSASLRHSILNRGEPSGS